MQCLFAGNLDKKQISALWGYFRSARRCMLYQIQMSLKHPDLQHLNLDCRYILAHMESLEKLV